MENYGKMPNHADLTPLGLEHVSMAYWNLSPAELIEETIVNGQGLLTDSGALAIFTGEFTGRSPEDRYIVKDDVTKDAVWWGKVNIPYETEKFNALYNRVTAYLSNREVYVKDATACADPRHSLKLRLVSEYPWSALFADNMFIRLSDKELKDFEPEWNVICAPGFMADPKIDGTRQHNFAIINFTAKKIIIGGTGYTGEIKKGIFSVLNFILPHQKNVLSMHCSANVGLKNDTAIFFGLSGTGKTTLSSDPDRNLIGDDEHGWDGNTVFNFEGGCYAKTINLTREQEPQIYDAIRFGALLENVGFQENSNTVNYSDSAITQNTRVSYPIDHIDDIMIPSMGKNPKNIFFLTADAFGVLPPISKLNKGQAMYHFISGYTAKVAGTEEGVTEPKATFSACFGAPFMPLHPTKYAEMLGKKMDEHKVNVWLINTGWSGGPYGVGARIKLKYTRAMITAALNGLLDNVTYKKHEIFGLNMPVECEDVPPELLDPRNTWKDITNYDEKANQLANLFNKNFVQFKEYANEEILSASPGVSVNV